jgi:hypothetical protein
VAAQKTAEISLSVTITVFPKEVYRPPETLARRAYRNLIYFHEVDRGGHFAAWKQPELFAAELRATPQAAPYQECEVTGKKHANLWRLTSPGTSAILRGVGYARGGSTLSGGSGAWRKTPDPSCHFILGRISHFGRTREAVSSRPVNKSLEKLDSMIRTCSLR